MHFAALLDAKAEGGKVTVRGDKLTVENAKAVTLTLSAATGFKTYAEDPDKPIEAILAVARTHTSLPSPTASSGPPTSPITRPCSAASHSTSTPLPTPTSRPTNGWKRSRTPRNTMLSTPSTSSTAVIS